MIKMVMFLLCELFLCTLGIFTKKSKAVFSVIAVFMWFYIAFTFDSADISNYRYAYDNNIYLGKDPLFYSIQGIFINLGFSFNAFKLVIGTLITLIFFVTIGKYKECISALAAICMFIPCGSFASQIRSGIAGIIVLFAISILASDKKLKVFKYLFWIGVASFIHQIALVYIVLLVPYIFKRKKTYIQLVRKVAIILCGILIVEPTLISVVSNFLSKFSNVNIQILAYRLSQMFSGEYKATAIGFTFNAIHHFVVFFGAEYSQRKEIQLLNAYLTDKEKNKIMIERVFNNTLLLLISFYFVSFHFVRAFYYVAPFIYAIMLKSVFRVRNCTGREAYGRIRMIIVLAVTLFVSVWGIIQEPKDFLRLIDGMFVF